MADQQDIIIIRRGQIQFRRADLNPDEANALDEIAAKGDGPLGFADRLALEFLVSRLAQRP
jgi:hypothetical protein